MPKLTVPLGFLLSISLLFLFPSIVNAQVVINEIHPSEEWVELINTSGAEASLDGCTLNMGNSGQDVLFGPTDTIVAGGYKVSEKGVGSWTGNWLNNGGDSVSLDCPLNDDVVSYGPEVDSKSYGRVPNGTGGFVVLASATKGATNSEPEPTSTPTSTPTPTPTPTPPPTKTPTPTPTKTPTLKPSPKSSPKEEIVLESQSSGSDQILGLREQLKTSEPEEEDKEDSKKKFPVFPVVLIIFGAGLMGFAGYTLFKKMKSEGYNSESEENI